MIPITTDILHEILLDIAKIFHAICVKNNIPYYMLGGTQLGASRHHGFIPWDDDMDFGVPREFFNKCIDCLEKELPPRYKLLSMQNSKLVVGLIVKIVDTSTTVKYHLIDTDEEYGVNVDIFPLDRTDGNKSVSSKNWWIQTLRNIDSYRLLNIEEQPFYKRSISNCIKLLLKPLNRTAIYHFIESKLILNKGPYIANHSGKWKLREIVPEDWFGVPKLYQFEDTKLYGVANYDAYLSCLYGDWHKLPSKDKQHIHLNNMFLK